jgi:hypothetical protein
MRRVNQIIKLAGRVLTSEEASIIISKLMPEGTGRLVKSVVKKGKRVSATKDEIILKAVRKAYKDRLYKDIPLKKRLKYYKQYKKTGRPVVIDASPRIKAFGLNHVRRWMNELDPQLGTNANELLTLYSGGRKFSLSSAIKGPMSRADAVFYYPGKTKAYYRGLYTSPVKDIASQYGDAVATLKYPNKNVVSIHNRLTGSPIPHSEVFIPYGHRKYIKLETIKKASISTKSKFITNNKNNMLDLLLAINSSRSKKKIEKDVNKDITKEVNNDMTNENIPSNSTFISYR